MTVVGTNAAWSMAAGGQTLSSLIGERLAEGFPGTVSAEVATMDEAVAAFLGERGRDRSTRMYSAINSIIEELDPAPGDALRDLAAIDDLHVFVRRRPTDCSQRRRTKRVSREATRESRSPESVHQLAGGERRKGREDRFRRAQSVRSRRRRAAVCDPRGRPAGVDSCIAQRGGGCSRVA